MDKIEEAAATSAYRPGSHDNYHRDTLTAASFNAPTIAVAPTPKPEIPTATLWINRLDDTLTERHIQRLVDSLAPVVSVERPKDKRGKLRSYAFVTLLSPHADMAIKHLNGKWVNERTCLQVQKSNKKRDVKTAVVKRGREVCRAYRSGQCLETCPFGHKHRWR